MPQQTNNLTINKKSELVKFVFTKRNILDVSALKIAEALRNVGDRLYISKMAQIPRKTMIKASCKKKKNMIPTLTSLYYPFVVPIHGQLIT